MRNLYITLCILLLSTTLFSQVIPNGKIDSMEELAKREKIYVPMSDGTLLSTYVYLPVTSDSIVSDIKIGNDTYTIQIIPKNTQYIIYENENITKDSYSLPLLFTRTPYNKVGDKLGSSVFPFLGFAYAIQDMRGRYDSEGVYFPMYSDAWPKAPYHPNSPIPVDITSLSDPNNALYHHDGSESVYYLAESAKRAFDFDKDGIMDTILYSNGKLGMFGASALGNSQYQALSDIPFTRENPIKCYMPIVATNEHYNTTLFHNGVFRNALVNGWIIGQIIDLVNDSIPYDGGIYDNIHTPADYNYANNLDLAHDLIDWFVADELDGGPSGAHPTSIHRMDLDASRAPINAQGESDANGTVSRYKNLNAPAYHLTGWWDIFINGQIETYRKIKEHNPGINQKLIIGPWTHQTIGTREVGDENYPANVYDILNFDMDLDLDNVLSDPSLASNLYKSEVISWFRSQLGGEPYFIIPEARDWQDVGNSKIRIPAEDYIIPYYEFINYVSGQSTLKNVPIEMDNNGNISSFPFTLPTIDEPLINLEKPLTPTNLNAFDNVKDIRMYITGPSNDEENENIGNYWLAADSLPFKKGIVEQKFFLHQNQTLDMNEIIEDEGVLSYIADPEHPIYTIGGNNMIPKVPDNSRNSQGSMNLANPEFIDITMNRPDVLGFITEPFEDTMSFVGFPKANIYAKGHTTVYDTEKTDFDVMVRILDVYPDGREMLITEGVVNARAREYAKSIYDADTNEVMLLTNIDNDTYYYFQFDMLPLGHTFGKGHQIKFLLSSSNYPKYQSNPHLPNEDNEFFRWSPGDTKTYNYQGQEMSPQPSKITYSFNPDFPNYITMPQLTDTYYTSVKEQKVEEVTLMNIYPNPTRNNVNIAWNKKVNGNVLVYNLAGELLIQKEIKQYQNSTSLNTQHLAQGVYIVKIPELNQTKKLVIE